MPVNFFDEPDEPIADGVRTGTLAAAQVMKAVRDGEDDLFGGVIKAARCALELDLGKTPHAPSKIGAASAFLLCVDALLNAACRELDIAAIVAERLQVQEEMQAGALDKMKATNRAAIAAMSAGQPVAPNSAS